MNIIIHGTKGGYRVLHSTPGSPLLAGDSRSATSSESAIGESAYSIAFTADTKEKGCVFTKFVIVRDIMRNMATGNIAFSIHLPNQKKLSGSEIKSLLDQLSSHYCKNYIPNNDLDNVYENWDFVDDIAKKFQETSLDDVDSIPQGTSEAAFIYYKDDAELEKYFSDPYQDKYGDYRQVFFVKEELRNKPENPLNALQHSGNDLTGKIDLENPKYKLWFERQNAEKLNITVEVGNKTIYNGEKVRKKDVLNINYSQDYRISPPCPFNGTWEEIIQKHPDCIHIDNDRKTISINPIELERKIRTITIIVRDELSQEKIHDFKITCKSDSHPYEAPKRVDNNQIEFKGDEIGEKWVLEVTVSEEYEEKKRDFTPEWEDDEIKIYLKKRRELTVQVINENGGTLSSPNNYIEICNNRDNKSKYIKNDRIVFVGNEIKQTWNICAKKGYEICGKNTICPANENTNKTIDIRIKKRHNKSIFKIGGLSPKLIPIIVCISIIALAATFCVLREWIDSPPKNIQQIDEGQINQYIEGNALILDTLKSYEKAWKRQKTEPRIKIIPSWLFFGTDSTAYEKWNEIKQDLDEAIKKRESIDSLNFAKLKKLDYSNSQQIFKGAVMSIDSTKYDEIKKQLGNISALTLNQIADSIKVLIEVPKEQPKELKNESKTELKDNLKESKPQGNKQPVVQSTQQQDSKDITSEIISYLKNNELDEEKLEAYKQENRVSKSLKKSIQLCLDFWSLNGSENRTYWKFREKINRDDNFKNSKLKLLLDKMCAEGVTPSYSKQDKKKGLRDI